MTVLIYRLSQTKIVKLILDAITKSKYTTASITSVGEIDDWKLSFELILSASYKGSVPD